MATVQAKKRRSAAPLFGYDIFISFALGPAPRGSRAYASDLAGKMRARDFTVFFSEDEAPPGSPLDDTLKRALRRSRLLVVLANRATLADPRWVRAEVEEFRRVRPDRAIIPISFDGSLNDPALATSAEPWLNFRDKIWIDENGVAGEAGIASDDVVERLATTPTAVRSAARLRTTMAALVVVFAALAAAAAWWAQLAEQRAREAESTRLAAESRTAQSQTLPDRALLLAAASWDTASTSTARSALLSAHLDRPRVLSYLPLSEARGLAFVDGSGTLAVVADDGHLRFFSRDGVALPIGTAEAPATASRFDPVRMQVNPASTQLAVASSRQIRLWDVQARRWWPWSLPIATAGALTAFSGDGNYLIVAEPIESALATRLSVHAIRDGAASVPPVTLDGTVLAMAPSHEADGVIVVRGNATLLWVSATNGSLIEIPADLTGPLARAACLPDGESCAVIGAGGRLLVHRLRPVRRGVNPTRELTGGPGASADELLFGSADRLYAAYRDGSVWRWNPWRPDDRPERVARHGERRLSLAASPDGTRLVVAAPDEPVALYALDREHHLSTRLAPPLNAATALAFSPDGRSAAAGDANGRVYLWDIATQKVIRHLEPELGDTIGDLRYDRGGRRLAATTVGIGARTAVWNLEAGNWLRPPVPGGAMDPTGRWVATTGSLLSAAVELLDLDAPLTAAPSPPRQLGASASPRLVAWSPDGERLAVSWNDGKVRIWNISRPDDQPLTLPDADPQSSALAFSADGRQLAAQHRDGAAMWTFGSAVTRRLYRGDSSLRRTRMVSALQFSPDGSLIALLHSGGLQLWDVALGEPLGEDIAFPEGSLTRLAFSPDGRWLAVARLQSSFLISMEVGAWRLRACTRAQRNLSCEEWERYFRGAPYRAICSELAVPADCPRLN